MYSTQFYFFIFIFYFSLTAFTSSFMFLYYSFLFGYNIFFSVFFFCHIWIEIIWRSQNLSSHSLIPFFILIICFLLRLLFDSDKATKQTLGINTLTTSTNTAHSTFCYKHRPKAGNGYSIILRCFFSTLMMLLLLVLFVVPYSFVNGKHEVDKTFWSQYHQQR